MSTGQQGPTSTRNCVACGRAIAWDANVCPFCGHDFRPAMSGSEPSGKKSFKGSLLILILLIIFCLPAGLIYLVLKWQ